MALFGRTDQDVALDRLRALCPRGTTVTTVVTHVSSSGMSRDILAMVPDPSDPRAPIADLSYLIARADIFPRTRRRYGNGVHVGGAGMDMAFHLVYTLASALYDDGYALDKLSL